MRKSSVQRTDLKSGISQAGFVKVGTDDSSYSVPRWFVMRAQNRWDASSSHSLEALPLYTSQILFSRKPFSIREKNSFGNKDSVVRSQFHFPNLEIGNCHQLINLISIN